MASLLAAGSDLAWWRGAIAAGLSKPLVMIDPGHGGSDPGCTGLDGVHEKTITLLVGFDLRDALTASGRYRIGMTRTRDVYVTLADRVAMTIESRANLFISLHCNHLSNAASRGALVFTLSRYPSDRLAAAVAKAENGYDIGPVSPQFERVSPQVAEILRSLELHATEVASKRVARDVVRAFNGKVGLLPNPDRSADFEVLRDPLVPSILIEMGCLSNRQDEILLQTISYRKLIAARICAAADQYFSVPHPERLLG